MPSTRSARHRNLKLDPFPPSSSARKGQKANTNEPFSLVDDGNHIRNSSQNSENLKITEIGDSA